MANNDGIGSPDGTGGNNHSGRPRTQSGNLKAYGASLTATTLFGLSYLFLKIALDANGGRIFNLLSYRFLLAAIALLILIVLGFVRLHFKGKNIKALLLMCLLNPALYFTLEILGVSRVASSEAGMMLSILPVSTMILGIIFLHERVTRWQVFFALLSISGIILINVCSYEPGDSSNLGRIILLLSILAGSSYSVTAKKISLEFSAIERTASMIFSGALFFTVAATLANLKDGMMPDYFHQLANPSVFLPVLYLGIGCSLVAFFMLNYAITHLPVSKTSIMANFATVVSILAGVIFRHEPFYWYHGVGSVIILLGVIGTTWYRQRSDVRVILKQ